jgi:tRNA(fMet)-specific endonuclease VapC
VVNAVGPRPVSGREAPARPHGVHHLLAEEEVLPRFTILAFDTDVARVYGQTRAALETAGATVAEADLQIASTALRHGLTMVTGNVRHFEKVRGLAIRDIRGE